MTKPILGVIEGFFGRDWGAGGRAQILPVLAREGYELYVYAPKSDRVLRQDWRVLFDTPHLEALAQLRAQCAAAGIGFGIGLTPYGLDASDWQAERQYLMQKLSQIKALEPDTLCLLFDDTPGGEMGLAGLHLRAAEVVLAAQVAPQIALCPAYYSDDPILDQVFGARPVGYVEALGQGLPPEIQVFWTGPKVVSAALDPVYLDEVAARLGRKPLIWDNGAVNDSRALSPFLPLDPGVERGPPLADHVSGLLVNPINQPGLAMLPLAKVARQWRGQGTAISELLGHYAGLDLAAVLAQDLASFTTTGFDGLGPEKRAELAARYAPFSGHPMAREVLEWLAGAYVFDPACLT